MRLSQSQLIRVAEVRVARSVLVYVALDALVDQITHVAVGELGLAVRHAAQGALLVSEFSFALGVDLLVGPRVSVLARGLTSLRVLLRAREWRTCLARASILIETAQLCVVDHFDPLNERVKPYPVLPDLLHVDNSLELPLLLGELLNLPEAHSHLNIL